MTAHMNHRCTPAAVLATAILAASFVAPPANAAPEWEDFGPPDGAGIACEDFPLQIQIRGVGKEPRELPYTDGTLRWQVAGKDVDYRFVNTLTGATYTLTRAASRLSVTGEEGASVFTITGTGWVVLFPTDIPEGPSTTVFSGKLVVKEGPAGVFTVTQWTGKKVDVCAAIS